MDTKILKADSKGRISLGSEFIGSFFQVKVDSDGIHLQKVKIIPSNDQGIPKNKLKKAKNLTRFAGAWEDMDDKQFDEFLLDVRKRRKVVSKRNKI